jgi:hypothetical protein
MQFPRVGVDPGGVQRGVAEQFGDGDLGDAGADEVGAELVTQHVRGDEDAATAIGVGLAAVAYALLEVADAIRSTGQQPPVQPPRRA